MLASLQTMGGRRSAFATAFIAAPIGLFLLLIHASDGVRTAQTSAFVAYAVLLGVGIVAYLNWRMGSVRPDGGMDVRLTGWLAVGLVIAAVQGLVSAVTAGPVMDATTDRWPLVNQLLTIVFLAGLALAAEHVDVPADPALVGTLCGLVLTAVHTGTLTLLPALTLSGPASLVLTSLVLLLGVVLGVVVRTRGQARPWVRQRIAISVVVLTFAGCAANLGEHTALTITTVLANLIGVIVLCTTTQTLLHHSLSSFHEEIAHLYASLAQARAGVRKDQELLHEVGATLAGITTASRVIQHGQNLSPLRRQRLEDMLNAELTRLERLMSKRAPSVETEFAIDDVIEPLVLSHQTRGRDILWTRTGLVAVGQRDGLAEVVNILLENAGRHGAGSAIRLTACREGDFVEITCSDSGPGIAQSVRAGLFTSGVRGPDSGGQGYGLAIARRLMDEAGGSLDLVDSPAAGATFVARLPRIEVRRVAAAQVA
jgi:signal transduction histidine kinase